MTSADWVKTTADWVKIVKETMLEFVITKMT